MLPVVLTSKDVLDEEGIDDAEGGRLRAEELAQGLVVMHGGGGVHA